MPAQNLLSMPAAMETRPVMTLQTQIRVFLLSDHQLLREALARAIKNQANILLVGAREWSAGASTEMTESTCAVLLVDPLNMSPVDCQVLDELRNATMHLKVVVIERKASITDVITSIHAAAQGEDRFVPVHETWPGK